MHNNIFVLSYIWTNSVIRCQSLSVLGPGVFVIWAHFKLSLSFCLQALERFYEAVMQAILRHINFDGRAAV